MDLVLGLAVVDTVVVVRRAEVGGAKVAVRLMLGSWWRTDCSLIKARLIEGSSRSKVPRGG